jgi:hypothetical protein
LFVIRIVLPQTASNFRHEALALMSVIQAQGWTQIVYLHSDDETGRSLSNSFAAPWCATTDMSLPVRSFFFLVLLSFL